MCGKMLKISFTDLLNLLLGWTPISVMIVVVFIFSLVVNGFVLYKKRSSIQAWFIRRLAEDYSQHALNAALMGTAGWITGAADFSTILPLWTACIFFFIKPSKES